MLDKNVGEINPLTGIEIVRAVNKKDRKVILVNEEFNKFNKIATVVMPVGTDQAIEELRGGPLFLNGKRRCEQGGRTPEECQERRDHRSGPDFGQGTGRHQGTGRDSSRT